MSVFPESARRSPAETDARCRSLDFDPMRAGRAIANLHLKCDSGETVIHYKPVGLKYVVAQSYLVGRLIGSTQAIISDPLDEPWSSPDPLRLDAVPVDTEPVAAFEDPDAGIVAWFAARQAAVEEDLREGPAVPAEPDVEQDDDAILTRQKGPRSHSWRGGGTMHRH
jgi:hypothetical protein